MVGGAVAIVGVSAYVLPRIPITRAWLMEQAIKGYAFLDENKGEVPEEYMGLFDDAYQSLDDVITSLEDGKISFKESMMLLKDALALVEELKNILANKV